MLRDSQRREQEAPSDVFKTSQTLQKSKQLQDMKVYSAWINWVLKKDNIEIKDMQLDLKDGIALVHLAQNLSGKAVAKYNKTPKSIHQKRENLKIAIEHLKKNGFQKQAQSVSEEDFEKDENEDTEKIDAVNVLGFLWQLMAFYQKKYFEGITTEDTKGMSKEQKFLQQLTKHIETTTGEKPKEEPKKEEPKEEPKKEEPKKEEPKKEEPKAEVKAEPEEEVLEERPTAQKSRKVAEPEETSTETKKEEEEVLEDSPAKAKSGKGDTATSEEMPSLTDEQPKIEDDNDDIPQLEEASNPNAPNLAGNLGESGLPNERKQSRSEKKARKAISKLGLRQISDIFRVSIKRGKDALFVINNPDVFKAPKKDIYIVFGDARMEDAGRELERAAQQFKPNLQEQTSAPQSGAGGEDIPDLVVEGEEKKPAATEDTAQGEEGVEAKDIELVMQQVACTRSQAIAALKKHGGDIVNAIMELQF